MIENILFLVIISCKPCSSFLCGWIRRIRELRSCIRNNSVRLAKDLCNSAENHCNGRKKRIPNWNWNRNPLISGNLFQSIEYTTYNVRYKSALEQHKLWERISTNCLGRLCQLCKLLTIYLIILQLFRCAQHTKKQSPSTPN